jgi:phosphatidylglycerophosphate synthase
MQSEDVHSVVPVAPILVLLPHSDVPLQAAAPEDCGEPRVLGLGLMRRTAMAASRAGYSQIYLLVRDQIAPAAIATIPDWGSLATALPRHQRAPLIIANAAIVGESEWLKRLIATQIEPASWAAIPYTIVMLAAATVPGAVAMLDAEGAYNLTAAQNQLTHHLGPPAQIPAAIDPMAVVRPTDIDVAERRLLRGLVKDTDGFMARHVERPISLRIVRRLASTAATPNQITLLSVGIGLCGAPFFLSAHWFWQTVGSLMFLAHSILDGCDGELARLRFQESRFGGVIDYWGDNVVHIVIFACMAAGWSLSVAASWPLLLGAAAALGNLGSAWFVYWRVMRFKNDSGPLFTSVATVPSRRLVRLLDAATRRDFIYLVLIFSLFGKANWFLLSASVGAPIFFFLLIFLAVRERH